MPAALTDDHSGAIPLLAIAARDFADWKGQQPPAIAAWLESIGFTGEAGRTALLPGADGRLARVLQTVNVDEAIWALGGLPDSLPEGCYCLDFDAESLFGVGGTTQVALGWALGSYGFTRYKAAKRAPAQLVWPQAADRTEVATLADAVALTRDMVNTPAEDMGPAELAAAVEAVGAAHGASVRQIIGDDLLVRNYPMIHAVGRGSARAPRLIDLVWGDPDHPKVTLVGKGVCFDTGGYDLKPPAGMKMMKKDMGGAATVLGLAQAIMASAMKVRLRVLIPAVENFVSSTAFRPMDIFPTRKGLTVEIGNTDAEGRLVLCDALAEAVTDRPDLLVDIATLTGAARVALGPELPALFSNDDATAAGLLAVGTRTHDPLWRMPLWKPYRKLLDSKIADLNNAPEGGFAGAVTAALYLQEFVTPNQPWVHIDTYAWNASTRPGRPEGGEALTLRAFHAYLRERFS
ncbi:MAG: leucyl aminopeptidase family protein [Aliidongia sp.]